MKDSRTSVIEWLVLIALPQQAARSRLVAALKKRGIQSVEATNGYMAVQLAGAKLPDCIVISENIGIYSLAKIRKLLGAAPETAKIPLLILGKNNTKQPGMKPQAVEALLLPERTQTLAVAQVIFDLLKKRETEQAGTAPTPGAEDSTGGWDKFIPAEFLALLGKRSVSELRLGEWRRVAITILFADIRAFSSLAEALTPEETFRLINSYLSRMGPVIRQHGGFIDKYIGDGIMALFPGIPRDALDAAVHMQKELTLYNKHRARSGYEPLRIGIGIHHGQAVLGTIGENRRIEVTVISDAVNLASRLEGLCKRYAAATIISEEALRLARPGKHFSTRYLDRVRVKGKQQPVGIHEVLDGLAPQLQKQRRQSKPLLEKAVTAWFSRRPEVAEKLFAEARQRYPGDPLPEVYHRRIERLHLLGSETNWAPIENLTE